MGGRNYRGGGYQQVSAARGLFSPSGGFSGRSTHCMAYTLAVPPRRCRVAAAGAAAAATVAAAAAVAEVSLELGGVVAGLLLQAVSGW